MTLPSRCPSIAIMVVTGLWSSTCLNAGAISVASSFKINGVTRYAEEGPLGYAFDPPELRIDTDDITVPSYFYKGALRSDMYGTLYPSFQAFTSDVDDFNPPGNDIEFRSSYRTEVALEWAGPNAPDFIPSSLVFTIAVRGEYRILNDRSGEWGNARTGSIYVDADYGSQGYRVDIPLWLNVDLSA